MTGSASAMTCAGVRVFDAQQGQVDPVEPDPLDPFLPRLREPVPGLGTVPDDREARGRARSSNTCHSASVSS
jgi:hypothetical protein